MVFIEDRLVFKAEEVSLPKTLLPEEIQDDLINAVVACHNGVYRMIPDAPEVVETSSNLSIVRTSEGLVEIQILVRSSSETMKWHWHRNWKVLLLWQEPEWSLMVHIPAGNLILNRIY